MLHNSTRSWHARATPRNTFPRDNIRHQHGDYQQVSARFPHPHTLPRHTCATLVSGTKRALRRFFCFVLICFLFPPPPAPREMKKASHVVSSVASREVELRRATRYTKKSRVRRARYHRFRSVGGCLLSLDARSGGAPPRVLPGKKKQSRSLFFFYSSSSAGKRKLSRRLVGHLSVRRAPTSDTTHHEESCTSSAISSYFSLWEAALSLDARSGRAHPERLLPGKKKNYLFFPG